MNNRTVPPDARRFLSWYCVWTLATLMDEGGRSRLSGLPTSAGCRHCRGQGDDEPHFSLARMNPRTTE